MMNKENIGIKDVNDPFNLKDLGIEFTGEDDKFIEEVFEDLTILKEKRDLTPNLKREEITIEYFSEKFIILSYSVILEDESKLLLFQVYNRHIKESKFTHVRNPKICPTYLMNLISKCESGTYAYK